MEHHSSCRTESCSINKEKHQNFSNQSSLLCSHTLASGSYSAPNECSPCPPTLLFTYILILPFHLHL